MAEEFKVKVGVEVNDSKLDELESRIKSIQDKTVKVNVKADTKEISNAVSTATKTMQGSGKTIKIKPVVDTYHSLQNKQKAYRYLLFEEQFSSEHFLLLASQSSAINCGRVDIHHQNNSQSTN